MRFLAQTGIKESDWSGKYWAKWSDAQAEAGFDALTLNSAYDEAYILKSVIALTRKLGRVPTSPEMRLEKRENQSFPNDKVIWNRWNRCALIERLSAFCATHPEFQDVEPIIKSMSSAAVTGDANSKSSPTSLTGYVYLIRAQGAFKIGCTRAPYRRAAEIANQSATGAELIHKIETDDPEGIEEYWHRRFAAKRLTGINKQGGEWFALMAEDIQAFKRRKKFM